MPETFATVDLFAGPGGLSEGFHGFRTRNGHAPFEMGLSVEMDKAACDTLRLRNFLRCFGDEFPPAYYQLLAGGEEPDWANRWPAEWKRAQETTLQLELKSEGSEEIIDPLLDSLRERHHGNTILLGGPPCQAYSLVGRARNRGKPDYVPERDHRHYLYEEYLRILERLRPAVFVMENVKGFLSSTVNGTRIFHRVLEDLHGICRTGDGYRLLAIGSAERNALFHDASPSQPQDFLVRTEEHGLPQARHRVFIIGIREDLMPAGRPDVLELPRRKASSLRHVLSSMPRLRSGLSRNDDLRLWLETVMQALEGLSRMDLPFENEEMITRFRALARKLTKELCILPRTSTEPAGVANDCPQDLAEWITDDNLPCLPNHETRGHMPSDLQRYLFVILFGQITGRSPKDRDFPDLLAPAHRNWKSGKFADRFRVQLWDRPSTTITSHISKDGHYFIHPDPLQCRSLTVREAARLQTFPDNYLFRGNRTQQYVQVGNAVPPYLARLLAEAIHGLLSER